MIDKDLRFAGGHDFRVRILKRGLGLRAPRTKHDRISKSERKAGISCYNCGIYTTDPDWPKLIPQYFAENRLLQCPRFQIDLFGGRAGDLSRNARDQWEELKK